MDSITQFSLGAVIGIADSPKKTPKVALISGLVAPIPDLDVFLSYPDALTNTIQHRGFSHSLFYLTLISPLIAGLLYKFFDLLSYFRWLILVFLVLTTHPILDSFTSYGTSLLLPFSDFKIMIGSIFIIDPIYTIPLSISIGYIFIKKKVLMINNFSFNTIALIFSQLYLLFTFVVQQSILPSGKAYATPTPFNSVLWRVVVVEDDFIKQYFVDIFGDKGVEIKVENRHYLQNINQQAVDKYANFSSGFYNLEVIDNKLILQDLRMGNIETPSFSFIIAELINDQWVSLLPSRNSMKFNADKMFGNE
jgi:inner membrane protein